MHRSAGLLTCLGVLAVLVVLTGRGDAHPDVGTFSIVAFDSTTGELGVAVQSRAFSVGSGVAWARAGVGAIATQSFTNESYGPQGLALLRSGVPARAALDPLLARDDGREQRQVGIVDARGRSASFTGRECMEWAGGFARLGLAAQGNILASEVVVAEMVRAYDETDGELSVRLLAALHAAQAAGGDRRGQQSAALLVVRPSRAFPEYEERYVSLRVEDHATPIAELRRLFTLHEASDLAEAHIRYAAEYRAAGNEAAADRELNRVGQTLERALADENTPAGALNALAWYTATNDVFLEQALEAARRAAAAEPESTEALDTLAECEFRNGNLAAALAAIQQALDKSPDDAYLKSQKEKFESAWESK
jgi:uncharacterized Ntn-hydrolase superfamily protein